MAIQYLSPEGLEKLTKELADLKKRSKELANRVDDARAQGDLSENAEYHEAKDALGACMGSISQIEETLKNYQIIEQDTGKKDVVRIGMSVDVNVAGKSKTFTIVGSNEADPAAGKISNESPIGSALLGGHVGEKVEVKTPVGINIYEIIAIR